MEKKVLYIDNKIISDDRNESYIYRYRTSSNKNGLLRFLIDQFSVTGTRISNLLDEIRCIKKPGIRLIFTIFMFSVTIIEEIILLAFMIIYFIFAGVVVILYMIFYEKIYEKLFLKFNKEHASSPSKYELDYSNLNLNCKDL